MSRNYKINSLLCIVSVVLALFLLPIHGQFFTKSSSKSIPRMGRRSVSTDEPSSSLRTLRGPYQRIMVDALIDKYGPDLLSELESKASGRQQSLANLITGNNNNNNIDSLDQYRSNELVGDSAMFSRDERRPSASNKPKVGYRDASLAMRALNTDRYIQHLASGGQPLISLESLLGHHASGGGSGKQQLISSDIRETVSKM